jgi:hypothetical protein
VLADFYQRDEKGVWTRPRDVLPGRRVRGVVPIIAAWGEMTWEAAEADRAGDPTLVWLRPVTEPAEVQEPRHVHSPERLAAAILADVRRGLAEEETWDRVEALLARALRRHLHAVLADFSATVRLLVQQVRRDRSVATALIRALAELPAPVGVQLLRSPVGALVYRLARRARPPHRRSDG